MKSEIIYTIFRAYTRKALKLILTTKCRKNLKSFVLKLKMKTENTRCFIFRKKNAQSTHAQRMNFSSRLSRLHNFSFRSLIRNENSAKCCKTLYRLCIVISSFGERSLHTFSYLYLLSVLFLAMKKIIARTLEPSFFIRQKFLCLVQMKSIQVSL